MKPIQYERLCHTIIHLEDHVRVPHKSINEAKRWSRQKQMDLDGALGLGSVRVAT